MIESTDRLIDALYAALVDIRQVAKLSLDEPEVSKWARSNFDAVYHKADMAIRLIDEPFEKKSETEA